MIGLHSQRPHELLSFEKKKFKLWLTLLYYITSVILITRVQTEFTDSRDLSGSQGFSEFRRISPKLSENPGNSVAGRYKRETREIQTTLKNNGAGHLDRLTVELPLDESLYIVDLELNKDLISDGYFERTQGENQEEIVTRPTQSNTDLCHYHGRIRGQPNSWAALSTCDGLRGMVFDGSEIHYLEPTKTNGSSILETEDRWETIHLKDSHRLKNLTCGNEHHYHSDLSRESGIKLTPRVRRATVTSDFHEPYNSGVKTRYVEMVVVVDKKKYEELGSDLTKVILRTKDIVNIVNALYVPLDIFVALVGVVVWTKQDAINISSKGDDTLNSFLAYRRERLLKDHPNDNAQLLTGREFEEGVVGKAMQGPICSYKFSGGVNSDHNAVVGIVATTIAHELGHNFGLSHDTESCKCDGPESKCIMHASSSSNRTAHWSSCSLESMNYAIEHGMDYCLRNKPRNLFQGPTCGNGFTEPGEECDCGHPEHCKNYCCNPHTCKLYSNATCAAGICCDKETCQLRSGGTVCRPDQSQCDLPEFCSGESEFCPDDVHKLDGLECRTNTGQAYCAGGECRTQSDQCALLWGPTGKSSIDACYQKNVNGSRHGHCGLDLITQKYTICARADIKCGILQCEHLHEKLEFGYEQVSSQSTFFVNVAGVLRACRSVTTDFGIDVVDPALAPDGAPCGTGKMCMKQKCVSVEDVKAPLLCPNDCNGNGICNSKGHCHCNFGYGGDECQSGGYGGSIDSGPIINPHGGASVFARALYVTFLGFIPLVGVISFYLYYAGDNLKLLFKRRQTPQAQSQSKSHHNGSAGGHSGGKLGNTSTTVNSNSSKVDSGAGSNGIVTGTDLFGQYKGFTLSPIRHASPRPTSHMNNNIQNTSNQNIQNIDLPQLPAIPATETQILVKNEKTSFLQKSLNRGVSWKEPVASSAPISPEQDDISNTSDTPLTALTSPKTQPKIRPLSSPDALNDSKLFDPPTPPVKKSTGFGSTSALSRIAAAFPFVRSFSSESHEHQVSSPRASTTSLSRQRSFNRDTLEISKPILQNLTQVESKLAGNLIPVQSLGDMSVIDSKTDHRYSNIPDIRTSPSRYTNVPSEESPKKSPRLSLKNKLVQKTVDRVKGQAPIVPPPPASGTGVKIQRAQSMIQQNRNSVVGNANYNSLRRSNRPTAPPPQPPEQTIPAIQPPPPLITKPSNKPNSILKFPNNNLLISKAPIAKVEESDIGSPMSSGSSSSPQNNGNSINSKPENIYDVIDEGEVPEKVETCSTGSSEGGGFGLLSEIISEIESRNKESIYNSVDRRKKKKEMLKTLPHKGEQSGTEQPKSPRITVNPNFKQSSPQLLRKSTNLSQSSTASPPLIRKPLAPTAVSVHVPRKSITEVTNPSIETINPLLVTTNEVSPNIGGKPTCAVNGIPKVTTSSPSYVAKINYFTNLNSAKQDQTAMKPISSLSQALITAAADKEKEPIYGPGQLSSIRPTWSRKSSIGKGEGGIYSKPVATPQIPTKEGSEQQERSRSRSKSPITLNQRTESSERETGVEEKPQGYKSFTPYLNRPLTFSTFRPSPGSKTSDLPQQNGMCSTLKPSLVNSLLSPSTVVTGVGLTSPVQLRSPSRLLKS